MDHANAIANALLSGQVGAPFGNGFAALAALAPAPAQAPSVGNWVFQPAPAAGDLVNVMPVYPGQPPRAGSPNVGPYYVGMPAVPVEQHPSGMQVQFSPPQYVAGDVTYLGFGATSIPAGSTGTNVLVSTERPFTPQKMGCPSTVIGLLVTQVTVSGTNILANQQGVPIELLSEVSTFPQVAWPSLDTATGVTFTLQNPTGGALVFSGAFYGTQVRR